MLGSLGSIIFDVAEGEALTYSDLSFQSSANFTEHKIIGSKPLLEFTGFNSDTCSLTVVLDRSMGINVNEKLRDLCDMYYSHEKQGFILDGQLVGSGEWVIENIEIRAELSDSFGGIVRANVSLKLKEFL